MQKANLPVPLALVALAYLVLPAAAAEPIEAYKCKPGFVWRDAIVGDIVCVTPESRALVKQENNMREARRNPAGASGPNSCILHYHANNRKLEDGDLLLVDAGCEYDYYASDVTRTWPVNGRFTSEQRAVYQVVLDAHEAAIAEVRAGNPWNQPHEAAVRVVTQGLKDLGLLDGSLANLLKTPACQRFFMHRTGHWLGMDVHDVGDYRIAEEWRVLEPGMTLTVEPGIYIKGVGGFRHSDTIIVTEDGNRILTSAPDSLQDMTLPL